MNEILWVLTLILSLAMVIVSYKFLGKIGLFLWIAIATVVANIQTVKLVDLFGIEAALGTILYGSTFLATDILNLKYGKKTARKSIVVGFYSMIIMTVFMMICLKYAPSANDFAQESLETIFTVNIRITIASLIAFGVSQFVDTILFEKLQKKFNKLWLSNNVSTMICQLIDTIIFSLITYYGLLDFSIIIEIMISMYVFKVVVALMDTPFIYLSKRIKNVNEL